MAVPSGGAYDARVSDIADSFNRSAFGQWINSPAGRAFRAAAGTGFLISGLLARRRPGGKAALAWGVWPFTAGVLDVCYVSAVLGGPLRGDDCRAAAGQDGTRSVGVLDEP